MADKTKEQLKAVEEIKSIHIQAAMSGGIERTDYYYSYY